MIKASIVWNEDEVNAMGGAGDYIIHGKIVSGINEYDTTCHVTAYINYLSNPSFENNTVTADVKNFDLIDAWNVEQSIEGAVKIESKNPRRVENDGHNNANILVASAYYFRLYQQTTLPAGTYKLSVWARSATDSAEFPTVDLFAESAGNMIEIESIEYGVSWNEWVQTSLTFTLAEETTMVVGVEGSGDANAWAHFDDFALQAVD